MSEEKKEKKPKVVKPITEVHLRSYPKIIFFYPLLFTSLICWIVQGLAGNEKLITPLGYFWMIVFFCNIFVMAFDFSSAKFFVLILAGIVLILLFWFFVLPIINIPTFAEISAKYQLGLPWEFYLTIFLILGILIFLVWIEVHFDYYRLERNEIYHKKGMFASAERFPISALRIKKEIPDVFEYFILRAGSITLMPGKVDEVIKLDTVLNVNKKAEQIDYLLSKVAV